MIGESPAAPDDDRLGPVVEGFLDRFRRGERPALTDLAARHPELAGQIRELIPALVELEQLGGAVPSSSGSRPGARGRGAGAPPPDRLGDYVILRLIGGGGMGVVYEAEHESLRSRVALKVMHPRFRADAKYLHRFHAEARLAAGLHHTNIVGVFDYGEQDGVCYYAMQFIDGQPLDLVLADIHRLRDEGTGPIGVGPAVAASAAVSGAVRGLFTGRFGAPAATADAGPATDEGPDASAPTCPIPAADAAPVWADPDATEALPVHPGEAPAEAASGDGSATLNSTSLGGSGEQRYYREIARVGAQVADALEYAHKRGVLHRDIKPSNLLLDAMGNVWVTDFGLAKLEEADGLTQSHELVGTLRYMAPERLRGKSGRGGDLYSLGATLYELLTLRPPFSESDQIRLIERIREEAPPPPRQLDRNIPRDLETIVLKALAKDPKDRFASAGELAGELRRFVEGRPIRSRPVSLAEQFWRWCKRERGLAAASIAAAVLTIVLAVGSTAAAWVYRDKVRQIGEHRDQIGRALEDLRRADYAIRKNLFDAEVARARATRFSRRPGQRFDSLAALGEAARIAGSLGLPPEELARVRDEAIACLALPDLRPTGRVIERPAGVIATAFDPTMTRYALRYRDGTISVRSVADDGELARFAARGDRDIDVFGFGPDGRYLASQDVPGHGVKVWDVDRRALVVDAPGPVGRQAAFRPDGRRILLNRGGTPVEYDLASGRPVRTWPVRADRLAFRPDGARVAVVDDGKPATCRILEAESGRLVRSFPLRAPADHVAWSPDGRTLAMPGDDYKIDLWDAETGIRRATLEGHINHGLSASFHPAGTLLASEGWEARIRLWDPVLGRPLLDLAGHSGLVFGRDGRLVVELADRMAAYEVAPALEYRKLAASRGPTDYEIASVRHDGRLLAAGEYRGAGIWDLARGTELAFLPLGNAWHLGFEPSGDLLTSGDLGVWRWPIRLDAGRGAVRIGPPRRLHLPASRGGLSQDRSGRIIALAAKSNAYVATPDRTSAVGPLDDCRYLDVSPDGRWLATGGHYHGAQVWRVADGTKAADLPIDGGTHVAFSPDGKWLVAGNPRLRLWEVGTWREEPRLAEVGGTFSPDGRIMVVVEPTRVLRLVEFATGRTLARLESPDLCMASGVAFSPDGARLVVTTNDAPSARVWDLRAIRKGLAGMGLDWEAPPYPEEGPAEAGPPAPLTVELDMGVLRGLDEEGWALYRQAIGLQRAGKIGEAIDALRRAAARCPGLAEARNSLAWLLATAAGPHRRAAEAVEQARAAVELVPDEFMYLNTYGVALYRAGRYAEAIPVLERSLAAGFGKLDGFDLYFLAMAHHRLGHREAAREHFDRALRWAREVKGFNGNYARELRAFRDEAAAVLAGPAGELPEDVFAPDR